jgi:3-hydroxyisobutyrate dehydrogenase-like beta-hydroxyacid dehydrogenase
MGAAAALRLTSLSFPVTVANRTAATASELAGRAGCQHVESFVALGRASDVVLVLTAGEAATRETVAGPNGILAGARPGTTVLVMSTVTPQLVRELAEVARGAGVTLADVPISGRPVELSQGEVTLFVGGRDALTPVVGHVLDGLGVTVDVGPIGAAAAMKLGVNIAVFGLVAAVAECLALTTASGVEPATAYSVLQKSAVASRFIDLRRQSFVSSDPPEVQFSMAASQETLQLIVQAADDAGALLPQTRTNLGTVQRAASSGMAADDITRLARFLTEQTRTAE